MIAVLSGALFALVIITAALIIYMIRQGWL